MTRGVQLPVLAVLGPSRSDVALDRVAEDVGRTAAEAGWVVLTGGGPGVMAAASRGAVEAGGLTVGVLPVASPSDDYPNPWVVIPIYTGTGSARNAFNVLSARACVAVGGGLGTLSEIALALKHGVPVMAWSSWSLTPPHGVSVDGLESWRNPEALVARLAAVMGAAPDLRTRP